MSEKASRKNKVIFYGLIFFYNESDMAQSLELLRKRGFGQELISKNIAVPSSLSERKVLARLFSNTAILDYEKSSSVVARFRKVDKEITRKKKLQTQMFLGYVSLYHSVLLQDSPSLYSLYFLDGMYQKIELSRTREILREDSWQPQQGCQQVFLDKKARTFCADLYRILKGENF